MSLVNESQDYDYYHQDEGIDQIWSFRNNVYRIKSQNVYCLHVLHTYNIIMKISSSSHIQNTLQRCRLSTKLRISTIRIRISVLIQFELRTKVCTIKFCLTHMLSSFSHVQNTLQPCRQSTGVRIMTIMIKTN